MFFISHVTANRFALLTGLKNHSPFDRQPCQGVCRSSHVTEFAAACQVFAAWPDDHFRLTYIFPCSFASSFYHALFFLQCSFHAPPIRQLSRASLASQSVAYGTCQTKNKTHKNKSAHLPWPIGHIFLVRTSMCLLRMV